MKARGEGRGSKADCPAHPTPPRHAFSAVVAGVASRTGYGDGVTDFGIIVIPIYGHKEDRSLRLETSPRMFLGDGSARVIPGLSVLPPAPLPTILLLDCRLSVGVPSKPRRRPHVHAQDSGAVYWFEVAAMPAVQGATYGRGLSPNNWRENHMRMGDSGNQGIVVFLGERWLTITERVQSQRNIEPDLVHRSVFLWTGTVAPSFIAFHML